MLKRLKVKILNAALKSLYRAVDVKDVITVHKDGRIFVDGLQLSDKEIKNIQEEAKIIEKMHLWKIMTSSLSHVANKKMYDRAESFEDMFFGKATLYSEAVRTDILKTFLNYIFKRIT